MVRPRPRLDVVPSTEGPPFFAPETADDEAPSESLATLLQRDASAILGPLAAAADALREVDIVSSYLIDDCVVRLGALVRRLGALDGEGRASAVDLDFVIASAVATFRALSPHARARTRSLESPSILGADPEHNHDGTHVLAFPPFRLDVTNETLWRGDTKLYVRAKPFTILRYLAERPLRLVTQDELMEGAWGKVVRSDSLLRTYVRELRQVLGRGIIETVTGRGYRFAVDVVRAAPRGGALRALG